MLTEAEKREILTKPILTRQDGGSVLLGKLLHERNAIDYFRAGFEDDWDYEGQESPLPNAIINNYVRDKKVLVVPGYSTNPFLFKLLGAKSVDGVDNDPISVTWMDAVKKYYYYKNIGSVLMGNTDSLKPLKHYEYQQLMDWPEETVMQNDDRDITEIYVIEAIREAIIREVNSRSFIGLEYRHAALGPIDSRCNVKRLQEIFMSQKFQCIYIPFLLGIKDGIQSSSSIIESMKELQSLLSHDGRIIITPFSKTPSDAAALYESNPGMLNQLGQLSNQAGLELEQESNFGSEFTFGLLK